MSSKKLRISFVTVCMNRLEHLKKTLLKNILDNSDDFADFILIDYNSSDGLEKWVSDNFILYLNSGKLKYFKTTEPDFFHRSHSRNLGFKLSDKEIICNVDADNFLGKNFSRYIKKQFEENNIVFLYSDYSKDTLGRVAVLKEYFLKIHGYDESFIGYGFEDIDIINRLKKVGNGKLIDNRKFLRSIDHSNLFRIKNEQIISRIKKIYVSKQTHYSSKILIVNSDDTYEMLYVTDLWNQFSDSINNISGNKYQYQYNFDILASGKYTNEILIDILNEGSEVSGFTLLNDTYTLIENPEHFIEIVFFYTQVTNRKKMERNNLT